MPTYQREVRVRAPLDEVWQFHSRIDGLEALTPDWMYLRVEEVHRPAGSDDGGDEEGDGDDDGDADLDADLADPDVLKVGTSIALSMRPFGVGPRQSWTSRIVRRETGDGTAVFEDVMDDGPFPEWRHRHQFYAISDDETLVRDRVTYELPVVGGLLGPLGWLGFEPMFRSRHRRTKEILESRDRE
jgi:ligand-binding SRPBCC domain-containing protein